ncbi:MAG: DUF3857 domain-containing protein, partial [Kiritimatiellaceae bacterium]|nr:DUF3857 domain-containing protein [Kiritimatiellaceae bacterium]
YEADGTYRYVSDTAYQIVTEKGRQEKSSVSVSYNTKYGTMQIVRAEVIKPDGRVVPIDLATQSREVIDQGQMSANIYDPCEKVIQLTVPDLGIGDLLRYTVASDQTKTVVPNTWSDVSVLEATFPIVHAVYEVDAPASLPLVRIELKDEIPGTVTPLVQKRGDRIIYQWTARNVPQLFEEPKMPAAHTVAQRLLLSTIPDWESLSTWYWNLSKSRLDAVNPAMQAKVDELTKGLTNRQDRIASLFRFVSQDIRYMGLTLEDEAPGYEPHDVSLTFDHRYGVCRDKAALLVSMLQLAGFEACPVLIYVGPKKDPPVPQPWFNHAITAVRNEDGSWQLMDATNENTRDLLPAYLSYRSYLVASPKGETLQTSPVIPPEENLLTIDVDASLDETDTITAQAVLSFNGINDTAYRGRLASLKPEERKPYFEERLKAACGAARLTELEVSPENVRDTTVPLSVRLKFEVENALAAGANDALLQVPTLINQFGLFGRVVGGGLGLDERRYPLYTEITCGVAETVRLDVRRSGLRSASLPSYETIDTPELYINRSVVEKQGVLESRAKILLRTVEFSPEQYAVLKQNVKASERNARKRVVLTRKGFPSDADFATINETVQYALYDATTWTEERVVQQKVLTYAGKKQLSDLRFSFNPAMKTTTLISATVTAPDGTKSYIDPTKEVNVMDAAWAGDAPRYPAEKVMVVNLPGVEVGSVIEYHVASSYKEVPFFSAMEYFAGHNPLGTKLVRVEMPHSMALNVDTVNSETIRRRTAHLNNRAVHEWLSQNNPVIQKEDQLPPGWFFIPTVLFSCGDLSEYVEQVQDAVSEAAEQNDAVRVKAKELTRGMKSRKQKIVTLRNFVDRTVREVGPGLSELPLSAITPADQVLAEGYGNSTDRAVLMYAMLDAAGLKPRFVLSSELPGVTNAAESVLNIPQRTAFNTVLVAVTDDEKKTVYLGDGGQYAEPGAMAHHNKPSINLKNGKMEVPQAVLPDAMETHLELEVAETGDLKLTQTELFYGTLFEGVHQQYAQFTPEELRRAHQDLLAQVSQSAEPAGELITDFSYPAKVQFSARVPAYAVRDGGNIYFTLPEGVGGVLGLKSSERVNPFYSTMDLHQTVTYKLTIPEGWEAVLLPESFQEELPAGAGVVDFRVMREAERILMIQDVRLNAAIVHSYDYDILLSVHNRLVSPSSKTVLLRKK